MNSCCKQMPPSPCFSSVTLHITFRLLNFIYTRTFMNALVNKYNFISDGKQAVDQIDKRLL